MNLKNKERKAKKISFEIYQDQEEKLNEYFFEVLKYTRNKDEVPSKVISNILEIFSEVWDCEDVYSFLIINQTYDRFKKIDFKSRRKIKYNVFLENDVIQEERFIKMTLKGLIEQIVILTAYKNYSSKKECVIDLVMIMNNICSDSLNKNKQKSLKPYMRYAIVGFITMKYGFYLFSGILEKPPTTQQLYKQVYDIINK